MPLNAVAENGTTIAQKHGLAKQLSEIWRKLKQMF